MHCFVNVLLDTTLLIYYGKFRNQAEEQLFESHKTSPYRNYIHAQYRRNDRTEKTIYITVLAEKSDILSLESMLRAELRGRVRISVSQSEYDGFFYLKLLHNNLFQYVFSLAVFLGIIIGAVLLLRKQKSKN